MLVVGRAVSVLALLVGALVVGVLPSIRLSAAEAAAVVADAHCRHLDPNLVHGACLRYRSRSGPAYTWIGSYRAGNGRVFFCIDYLYDSRIAGRPSVLSTERLVNQLGVRIGDAEVAALNYLVSTWASRGSTGSDTRDAAIALIIRELMSDGVRPDGTVVYPSELEVGDRVRPPVGGLGGPIMATAQQMWDQASRYYGGYQLRMGAQTSVPIELGTARTYGGAVLSATGNRVPGVQVRFSCTGPVACPGPVTTGVAPVQVVVRPRDLGTFTVTAQAEGPAADGQLYRVGRWRLHGGRTAQDRGVQRGWIADRRAMTTQVRASAVIVKGTPDVLTRATEAVASPGAALSDVVTVSQLPSGYHQAVTANLYGPFTNPPGAASCTPTMLVGTVSFLVDQAGTVTTPTVAVSRPGYYVWTESLPGDVRTNAVTTPCGIAAETTVVSARTPDLRTQASRQRALVGRAVYDTVLVSGLGEGDRIQVTWTLRGPLAPRRGSCSGLDWTRAGVLATGSFGVSANGRYRTGATVLRVPGCVTFEEHSEATTTTVAAGSDAGLPTETMLVTRPPTPIVPEIPTGPELAPARVR